MVVISGLAIKAGSRCTRFARSGRQQPMALAMITVRYSDSATTRETGQSAPLINRTRKSVKPP